MPGSIITATPPTIELYVSAIRDLMDDSHGFTTESIRDYWQKQFDIPVIKAKWIELIKEVESGTSESRPENQA